MKNQAKWAGQIRHVLTAAGGVIVALGVVPQDQVVLFNNALDATLTAAGPLVGSAMVVGGALWSWASPAKKIGGGDFG